MGTRVLRSAKALKAWKPRLRAIEDPSEVRLLVAEALAAEIAVNYKEHVTADGVCPDECKTATKTPAPGEGVPPVVGWPSWDDGSLSARLADEPGLADTILGRDPLTSVDLPEVEPSPGAFTEVDPLADVEPGAGVDPLTGVVPLAGTPLPEVEVESARVDSVGVESTGVESAEATLMQLVDDAAVTGGYQAGQLECLGNAAVADPELAAWPEEHLKSATITNLSATIEMLVDLRRRRNALETAEALLLERARLQAMTAKADLVSIERVGKRRKQPTDAGTYVETVVVSDLALALHDSHDALAHRMRQAHALYERACETLTHAVAGRVNWRNAAILADKITDLDTDLAIEVDDLAAPAACTDTPGRFQARLRRILDSVHPDSAVRINNLRQSRHR